MLKRQGIKLNRKKLYRLYKEEKLSVRKRGGRKRALGTRAPMAIPQGRNLRWSLDFVADTLVSGRRFRILTLVDDFTRECLGLVVDTSLTGLRVARELDRIAERRPRLLLDLDEDKAAPTAHDQVELDAAGTDVAAEDAVPTQPVMPRGPALGGATASGGARPRPR